MLISEFKVPLRVYASIMAHCHHIPSSDFRCTDHIWKDLQDSWMNASACMSASHEIHFCKLSNCYGRGNGFMFGCDARQNNGKKSRDGGQNGGSWHGSSNRQGVISGCSDRCSWGGVGNTDWADVAAVFAGSECQHQKHSSVHFLPWMANVSLLIEATNTSSISSLLVGISSVLAMGDGHLDGIVVGEVNVLSAD